MAYQMQSHNIIMHMECFNNCIYLLYIYVGSDIACLIFMHGSLREATNTAKKLEATVSW